MSRLAVNKVNNNYISTAIKYRPLRETDILEILELMVENNSLKAQTEFYYRYRSFLLQVCRKGCSHFVNGEQLADDIFQNTLIKALSGIMTVYEKLSKDTTKSSNYIKAWLSVIAKNELIEFLRKNPDEKKLSYSFRLKSDEIDVPVEIINQTDDKNQKPSIEREKLEKGLALLSEKEKDILITYMIYQNNQYPNRHLPDEVIARLCVKHNVKSDNLRQIKRRALLKLKKECYKKMN